MYDNIQKIFDENKKIHNRTILEIENRRIYNWLKKLDQSKNIKDILTILYMATCNESNRCIKILIQRAKELNDEFKDKE